MKGRDARMSDDILIHIGPPDGDRETIRFNHKKLLNVEAMAIERATGITTLGLLSGMASGSLTAVTAAVWIMRKRANPKLQFDEVVFNVGDYELEDPDLDEQDNAVEAAGLPKSDEATGEPG